MTAIGFYHLTRTGAEAALAPLLGRTLGAGQRALVACAPERIAPLDQALWLAPEPDWLPHGPADGPHPDRQPILLATGADTVPANGARFLFLLDGLALPDGDRFERVFDLFNGADPAAVAAARARWTAAKAAGHTLSYWRQTARSWEPGP